MVTVRNGVLETGTLSVPTPAKLRMLRVAKQGLVPTVGKEDAILTSFKVRPETSLFLCSPSEKLVQICIKSQGPAVVPAEICFCSVVPGENQ